MTLERDRYLLRAMTALLTGAAPLDTAWPDEKEAFAWRVIRWEADMPLTEEERESILAMVYKALQPVGLAAADFDRDNDVMTILLCMTRFPAKAQRDMVLWLCLHALMENAYIALAEEGTMSVGEEFAQPKQWAEHTGEMHELSDWWSRVSAFDGPAARERRTRLQTIIKRRQYNVLGGYVSRALRGTQEIGKMCFAFVVLVIEAVWSQHEEISLQALTEGLNLAEMARRPREALLAWLTSLQGKLRQTSAIANVAPIERVIAGIRADCSLPYTQQNLSRSLGLTPAYFCRLFHEKTGQHFSAFLTRTRMEKAQELLSGGQQRSLTEISAACGYPNKSYFCQVFKKYTGLTPGEFEQKALLKKEQSKED